MDASELVGPAVLAISSAPLFVLAVLVGRGNLGLVSGLDPERVTDRQGLATRLAWLLAALGAALLAAAGGFVWAGADQGRIVAMTIALVVVANAIAILLLLAVARAKRDYRNLPARQGGTGRR